MKIKHLMVSLLVIILMVALLLPACAGPEEEEPTTSGPTTSAPTQEPTKEPTQEPTKEPTQEPTKEPTQEPTEPVEARIIKFNYTMPPGSAVGVGFEWWADEFEARTDGRYVVETYGFSALVDDAGSLDAVKSGVCEIVMTSSGSKQTDFPLAHVTDLPTLTFHRNGVTFEDFLASFDAFLELLEEPEVAAEFEDYHLIKGLCIDPSYLISKDKEVILPEDLEGLKVGAASGPLADLMTALGAAGVFQIPPQAYDNMDKGVTTAAFMTYAMIGPYNMFDICDYILKQTFAAGTLLVMTSHEFYASLPPEDQQIFDESWEDALIICAQGMYDETVHSTPVIEQSGIKIHVPTAEESQIWFEACQEYAFPTWIQMCVDLGYDAAVAERILAKWQELIIKYTP
jgi:TRAP-type C4-dicarboxylate transport system substrate-binding protein